MKKNILFIHHGGSLGGAPLSMLGFAKTLKEKQYSVTIIFTNKGPILDLAESMGMKCKVVSLNAPFFIGAHVPFKLKMFASFLLYLFLDIIKTIKILVKYRPEIVYLNTSVLISVAIGARLCSKYIIWHIREAPVDSIILRKLQIKIINFLSDKRILTSNYIKQYYPSCINTHVVYNTIEEEQYINIPSAVREGIRSELNIGLDKTVLVMLGNVQDIKGHFLFAQAAENIIKNLPNVRIIIAGKQSDKYYKSSLKGRIKALFNIPFDDCHKMQLYINSLGLSEYFIFTGWRNDIASLLYASDLLLFLPQKPEGFGRPLIEAMASGLPIITTNIGPSKEICTDKCARFIPADNKNAIEKEIISLINDHRLRKTMGTEGKNRYFNIFSNKKLNPKLMEIVNDI